MTAIEEIQSADIYQINGNEEYDFDETETTPLDPTLCNSRFFCTKRQQYLDKNQTDTNGRTHENLFPIFEYQSDV